MIEFKNISKIYSCQGKEIRTLDNVSFKIEKGEFVSIVGKSGAGKTTLLKLLIGQAPPTKGEVFFQGRNVGEMSPSELQNLRRQIGVVHQDYQLLPLKTARENVDYIMQVIGAADKDILRDVPQVLALVGLEERSANFPAELSGGEKQRLAIARALCHRPEVILADEPTGNLDLYNTFELIDLFSRVHKLGTTVILATHDKEIVDRLQKRVITLEEGRVVRDDPTGKFIL